MLGKCSTTKIYPQPIDCINYVYCKLLACMIVEAEKSIFYMGVWHSAGAEVHMQKYIILTALTPG